MTFSIAIPVYNGEKRLAAGRASAVSEAMAAGCVVIATNFGGTITQIVDGYNGLLCFSEKEELLKALLSVIDHPEERLRMQKTVWEFIQRAFLSQGGEKSGDRSSWTSCNPTNRQRSGCRYHGRYFSV